MQIPLFFERYEDAIRATIDGIGGAKSVGNMLWPTMAVDEAGRRVSHCLNTEKREKFCPNELAMIRREARKKGVHILASYEARDAGYADPQPVNVEDEAAQLQREYIAAVKGMQALTERIERNNAIRSAA